MPYFTFGGPFGELYGEIDYSLIKTLIFSTLYNTHSSGKSLLSVLSSIEKHDSMFVYRSVDALFQCECPESDKVSSPWQYITPTLGIACGDAAPINETLQDAVKLYEEMAQNTTFSDTWPIHLYCS